MQWFSNCIHSLCHIIRTGAPKSRQAFSAFRSLNHHTTATETRAFLELVYVFRCFAPSLYQVSSLLESKILESKPETIDALYNNKMTALKVQRARLVLFQHRLLKIRKAPKPLALSATNILLKFSLWGNNPRVLTVPLDSDIVCPPPAAPNSHGATKPNVSLCDGSRIGILSPGKGMAI